MKPEEPLEQKNNTKHEIIHQHTDDSTHLCDELINVDISSIKVPREKIHPKWESLLQLTQRKVTNELDPEFKLSEDLSKFSLHTFPSLNYDFVSCILIFNMSIFVLDDHFDKYPNGKSSHLKLKLNFP